MKFRPLHDRVVVRRLEEEERSKGGIIIPDTAKEKPQQGEVVAVLLDQFEIGRRRVKAAGFLGIQKRGMQPQARADEDHASWPLLGRGQRAAAAHSIKGRQRQRDAASAEK